MPVLKFKVKTGCSYGKKGQVIQLNVPESGLTERQKVMLEEYSEPEVIKLSDDEPDAGDGSMTKPQIIAKLKELGIEHNAADKKEVLLALLPKA